MADEFGPAFHAPLEKRGDTIIKELHADMRALRDTEFKNAALFYQVCAFLVAGGIYLFTQKETKYEFLLQIFMSIFLIVFWSIMHMRVTIDHDNYAMLGDRVTHIRKLWGLDLFLHGSTNKPFGHGIGYRATQVMMAVTAVFVLLILIGGAILKARS